MKWVRLPNGDYSANVGDGDDFYLIVEQRTLNGRSRQGWALYFNRSLVATHRLLSSLKKRAADLVTVPPPPAPTFTSARAAADAHDTLVKLVRKLVDEGGSAWHNLNTVHCADLRAVRVAVGLPAYEEGDVRDWEIETRRPRTALPGWKP